MRAIYLAKYRQKFDKSANSSQISFPHVNFPLSLDTLIPPPPHSIIHQSLISSILHIIHIKVQPLQRSIISNRTHTERAQPIKARESILLHRRREIAIQRRRISLQDGPIVTLRFDAGDRELAIENLLSSTVDAAQVERLEVETRGRGAVDRGAETAVAAGSGVVWWGLGDDEGGVAGDGEGEEVETVVGDWEL